MKALHDDVVALFDHVFARATHRLDGITDAEYLWEPAPGCWTVRDGSLDGEGQLVDHPPVTTIGWRICHVADAIARHPLHGLLKAGFSPSAREFPTSASAGVSYLTRSYAEWRALLDDVDDSLWLSPLGPDAGPFSDSTALALVLHNADELIHHLAEVALLRDLFRHRGA